MEAENNAMKKVEKSDFERMVISQSFEKFILNLLNVLRDLRIIEIAKNEKHIQQQQIPKE